MIYSEHTITNLKEWALPALSPCVEKLGDVPVPKPLKEPRGVAAKVEELVRPIVENMGLRLWDVRLEKEGGGTFLRIFIDRDTPLDTDTCEAVSRAIDPVLDEADPIEQSYYLEVGSPGLGRRLSRRGHFEQMAGCEVAAKLYAPNADGHKEVRGALRGLSGDAVLLQTAEGLVQVPLKDAADFRLCDDEHLFD